MTGTLPPAAAGVVLLAGFIAAECAVFRDTGELYAYLTARLAGIPGLRSVETAPIIGTLKRAGARQSPLPVREEREAATAGRVSR
ncbi:MAG TPA: hypothetical protein VG164_00380 [Trebonia sp.]|nr:hypothetical protein [Trebonia sp.]